MKTWLLKLILIWGRWFPASGLAMARRLAPGAYAQPPPPPYEGPPPPAPAPSAPPAPLARAPATAAALREEFPPGRKLTLDGVPVTVLSVDTLPTGSLRGVRVSMRGVVICVAPERLRRENARVDVVR